MSAALTSNSSPATAYTSHKFDQDVARLVELLRRRMGQPAPIFSLGGLASLTCSGAFATQAASVLAVGTGKRVLLIDCAPGNHCQIHTGHGLQEVLEGKAKTHETIVPHPRATNLSMLRLGGREDAPAAHLASRVFDDFLTAMRAEYDAVILHAGLLDRTEAGLLVSKSVAMAAVVPSGQGTRRELQLLVDGCADSGCEFLGFAIAIKAK